MPLLIPGRPRMLDTARGGFRVAIDGEPAAPALVLSNSLGTTLEMWDGQAITLAARYCVIRYDTRGHGGSLVSDGPYTFDDLGQDVLAILNTLQLDRVAFCGISMGGHTGLWLGINAGNRFRALAVCNSAAKIGVSQAWRERAAMVRKEGSAGMQILAESAPGRWFGQEFGKNEPETVQCAQGWLAGTPPEGYAACCDALAESDLRSALGRIAVPTLLLAGAMDAVTTVADAQAMQAEIPGARLMTVPASHLSNLEAPQAFVKAIDQFLDTAAHAG